MTTERQAGRFATTPEPPYYAVIFTNQAADDTTGYAAMAQKMMDMALDAPGCLGAESTRDENGFAITVSYWQDEAAILDWKAKAEHLAAQRMGIDRWYARYTLRVAKVERDYTGPAGRAP